jgi:DNA invertase Pin-like site-specific DNA recombinase
LRAAGYIRVSDTRGRQGDSFLSPEVQKERIEAWANWKQARVVEWYIDLDVSGRAGVHRPSFERMMADAKDRRFDMVCVYRLTRFGRSVKDTANRFAELQALGIGLASATEPIDTTGAVGEFVQNMLFSLAEFESKRIGEEWKNVHANRRGRGLHHVPRGLFGYRIEGAVPVAVEPAEARAVRELFARRAAGASLGELRGWLQDEGYRPPRGGSRFSISSLSALLKHPAYAGLVRLENGELAPAANEAIVSRDLWEQVQRLFGRTSSLNRFRTGLVSGLVVCDSCDYRMSAWARPTGPSFYRCSAFGNARECPRPTTIQMPRLDDYVEGVFRSRLSASADVAPRRGMIRRGGRDRWEAKEKTLTARSEELALALDRLTDQRFIHGVLGDEEYERQTLRLIDARRKVEVELEEARALAATTGPSIISWADSWENAPLATRQAVLRRALRQIRVRPGRRGNPQPPLGERVVFDWLG